MGVYYDRVLQYEVVIDDSVTHVIASGTEVDNRLAKSKWLHAQGGVVAWTDCKKFGGRTGKKLVTVTDDFDIELTPRELTRLRDLEQRYNVTDKGWWDIVTLTTTY